jgi:hypothetical protein
MGSLKYSHKMKQVRWSCLTRGCGTEEISSLPSCLFESGKKQSFLIKTFIFSLFYLEMEMGRCWFTNTLSCALFPRISTSTHLIVPAYYKVVLRRRALCMSLLYPLGVTLTKPAVFWTRGSSRCVLMESENERELSLKREIEQSNWTVSQSLRVWKIGVEAYGQGIHKNLNYHWLCYYRSFFIHHKIYP